MTKTGIVRTCLYFKDCGIEEEYNGRRWRKRWFTYKDGYICNKHYCKLRPKEYLKKYNDRQITFLGKIFYLSWKIRTGYCTICKNNIFDNTCKITQIHHWFYVPIMIWACTEEVCSYCHVDLTMKLGQRKNIPLDRKCVMCNKTQAEKPRDWRFENNKWYCKKCYDCLDKRLDRAISHIISWDFLYIF